MSAARRRAAEPGAIELCEEATHLLRQTPPGLAALYLTGTLPFALAFLYFWNDMRLTVDGAARLPLSAAVVAVLFLWMKVCQALCASSLRAIAAGSSPHPITAGRIWRVALSQAAVQPLGLVVLPLSAVALLPFPWTFAFWQNLSVLDEGAGGGLRSLAARASLQARRWPRQGILLQGIFAIAGLLTLANIMLAALILPGLLKTLFGVETLFTMSGFLAINGTLFLSATGVTLLLLDPLVKAVFALRCHYGEALATGEDLRAELGRLSRESAAVLMLSAVLCTALQIGLPVVAQDPSPPPSQAPSSPSLSPGDLDRSIEEVLRRREFAWRLPREKSVDITEGDGVFITLVRDIADTIENAVRSLRRGYRRFLRWLNELFPKPSGGIGSDSSVLSRVLSSRGLILAAAGLVLAALVLMLLRARRSAAARVVAAEAVATDPAPDLSDPSTSAGDQPEDGWQALAHEMAARGEYRLAVRALFLATLAHLGERDLLRLTRTKSNGDYARELRRRCRDAAPLLSAFGENLDLFESCWYGLGPASVETVAAISAAAERIRLHAA